MNKLLMHTLLLCCCSQIITSSEHRENSPAITSPLQHNNGLPRSSTELSLVKRQSTTLTSNYDGGTDDENQSKQLSQKRLSKHHTALTLIKELSIDNQKILQRQIDDLKKQNDASLEEIKQMRSQLHGAHHGWIRSLKNNGWFSAGLITGTTAGTLTITSFLLGWGIYRGIVNVDLSKIPSIFQVKK